MKATSSRITRSRAQKKNDEPSKGWVERFSKDPIGTLMSHKTLWVTIFSYAVPSVVFLFYLESIGQPGLWLDVVTTAHMIPVSMVFCAMAFIIALVSVLPSVLAIMIMEAVEGGWKFGVAICVGATIQAIVSVIADQSAWLHSHVHILDCIGMLFGPATTLIICSRYGLISFVAIFRAVKRRPIFVLGFGIPLVIAAAVIAMYTSKIISGFSEIAVSHLIDLMNRSHTDGLVRWVCIAIATVLPVFPAWMHVLQISRNKPF
jgi:hypothetical protein